MNFNGRWVPLEVMDTIVLSWVIVALLLGVVLFRFARSRAPKKPGHNKPAQAVRSGRKKRASQRKS